MQNREFFDGDLVPGTRYRVVGLLGFGGMGTVYEVEHVELGKRFVLKALMRELARREDLVQRLRNEWRALGRLEHPNIVTVTDAGSTSTGAPYYVMERLEGETLATRLRRSRRLPVPEALNIAAGVLDGLSAAHDIGVIHRDVKPPNIFLVAGDRPKVLDFGVAKVADAANVITARGVAVGTPRYMSPEQARGERLDGRSDIYALGLVLFEAIAGVGPFDDARDANALLLAHLAREVPRLGSLVAGVLPEVDEIVGSLLAKDARARPGSARELASTLRDVAQRYAERVSSSDFTPAVSYSSPTVETASDRTTRQFTTRPDGLAASTRSTSGETTRITVSEPPAWQTDAASSGSIPTVTRSGPLPLPPEAYTQSTARLVALPVDTIVDPATGMHTAGAALLTPSSTAALSRTARFGTPDAGVPLPSSGSGNTERLPEVHSPLDVETRTRVPAAEAPSAATPLPVVPQLTAPSTSRRRGVSGALVFALLAAGALVGVLVTGGVPAEKSTQSPGQTARTTAAAASLPVLAPAAPASAVTAALSQGSAALPPPSVSAQATSSQAPQRPTLPPRSTKRLGASRKVASSAGEKQPLAAPSPSPAGGLPASGL